VEICTSPWCVGNNASSDGFADEGPASMNTSSSFKRHLTREGFHRDAGVGRPAQLLSPARTAPSICHNRW